MKKDLRGYYFERGNMTRQQVQDLLNLAYENGYATGGHWYSGTTVSYKSALGLNQDYLYAGLSGYGDTKITGDLRHISAAPTLVTSEEFRALVTGETKEELLKEHLRGYCSAEAGPSKQQVQDMLKLAHELDLELISSQTHAGIETKEEPMTDINATLDEREERYGAFSEHARLSQGIKRVMVTGRRWDALSDSPKEALEMVAHKIARVLNGDPGYADNWHDIAGYVTLVERELAKTPRND